MNIRRAMVPTNTRCELIHNAHALLKAGRLMEATSCCRRVLDDAGDEPEALHILGLIAYQQGEYRTAIEWLSKAVAGLPDQPHLLHHLGLACGAAGENDRAVFLLRRAQTLAPENAEILGNLGLMYRAAGTVREAGDCFEAAIRLAPEDPDHRFNLGCLMADQGHFDEAEHYYRQALHLRPDFGKAHNNLGNTLRAVGRTQEAIDSFREALRTMPESIAAMNNLGNALRAAGRFPEAERLYRRALALDPKSAGTWCNLGNVYRDERRFNEATASYTQSLELKPGFAEAHFNRACIYLLKGQFEKGWKEYEWRLQRQAWTTGCPGRLNLPRWQGEPFIDRRLLVYDEQGLGDSIQFARYLPMAKALGGSVLFEARQTLLPLFRTLNGVDQTVERISHAHPAAEADVYVPLLSLPGIFRTGIDTIPWNGPYLGADAAAVRLWRSRFGAEAYRIGIVWAGSNVDPRRAFPPALLEALTRFTGVGLYSLQKEDLATNSRRNPTGLVQLGPDFADFGDTAAAIAHLDLVISVDTAVAHLAGAMGKPVWVLLPYMADWRWLQDREDSPWYPTMRLFRQQVWGDWRDVMARVAHELERKLQTGPATREMPS